MSTEPAVAFLAPSPARGLVGDLRISGSVLRGTRTEWLPFPCHPREYAFLADLDPTIPVQYWEQKCGAKGCGMEFRFEHVGRHIRWHPIVELTDAGSPQAVPLDRDRVEARLPHEGDGNAFKSPVPVTHDRESAGPDRVPRFIRRPTSAPH